MPFQLANVRSTSTGEISISPLSPGFEPVTFIARRLTPMHSASCFATLRMARWLSWS